jgi:hypothetical protein
MVEIGWLNEDVLLCLCSCEKTSNSRQASHSNKTEEQHITGIAEEQHAAASQQCTSGPDQLLKQ